MRRLLWKIILKDQIILVLACLLRYDSFREKYRTRHTKRLSEGRAMQMKRWFHAGQAWGIMIHYGIRETGDKNSWIFRPQS